MGNLFLSLIVIVFSCEVPSVSLFLFLWAHSSLTFPLAYSVEAACFDVSSSPLLNLVVFSRLSAVSPVTAVGPSLYSVARALMLLGFLYSPDTPLSLLFHFLVLFMLYPRSQCRLPSQTPGFACQMHARKAVHHWTTSQPRFLILYLFHSPRIISILKISVISVC